MSETLNALSFPLWGSRLIEASAGTGKTWTIAALYLRLVLGHGGADGFVRPLLPSEILVMTFTRAATRELSDRIRQRLLEAARCFRGEAQPQPSDGLLLDLLAAYPEGGDGTDGSSERSHAAWRLGAAADAMDDAAVHTIDAWCQRMLREHAFDSGCLFDEELIGDEAALQLEAAQDYWRQQLYPLAGPALDQALQVWHSVDALANDAGRLLEFPLPLAAGAGNLGALIDGLLAERTASLAALKQGWVARAAAMQHWLDGQLDSKSCPFDKRKMAPRNYSNWLAALSAWADDPAADIPDLKTGATRFTPAGMQLAFKPGAHVELPDEFPAFEQLMLGLDALPQLAPALRSHAAVCIGQRLSALKRQAGTFGFADMLNRLDAALDESLNGAAAERLRERMLAQYPVALIDEFQDTSPLQARIFDRLYRIDSNDPQTSLLLIGDPKQSIYGFRGADIYSYLDARSKTAGRHYVLGTNHRSTQALVSAVNHLFERAEQRAGEGAFMFRPAEADNPLPFVPVNARGRAEQFVSSTAAQQLPEPAITLTLDTELRDGLSSQRLFAARCAERIVTLLNDPGAGFAKPGEGAEQPGDFTRLAPADIAVLVRTGREAAAVRLALRRRGVASVYLSDKDSVFASPEASDLLRWLKAVAAPLDTRLVRAALATRTAGLDLAELLVLAADDEAFDRRSEQLKSLHSLWQTQGVLAMLRHALHLLDLPARCLAVSASAGGLGDAVDGERRLTNYLHLAELLQAASTQLDGEQALIRWLSTRLDGGQPGGDEQIVRLESDADLVKVVTVHKSKGLEYPLVFLPFACSFRGVDKARTSFVNLGQAGGERRLHLHLTAELIAAADKERQREDLRLLYVALTRARHALWVGLAALKVGNSQDCTAHRSAIGYLLGGAEKMDPAALQAQTEQLVATGSALRLLPAPGQYLPSQTAVTLLQARAAPTALSALQPYQAGFERRWTIGSFSALVRALAAPTAVTVAVARDDETLNTETGESAPLPVSLPTPTVVGASGLATVEGAAAVDDQPWHRFPRGAMAGNFLHDQLEWLAGEGFALEASPELQQQLLRRCERDAWGPRAPAVQAWLVAACKTVLSPVGVALLTLQNPLPEMEFWFPAEALASVDLDALCRLHLLDGAARPTLPERELRGMLMGFADLVFEQGGRYFVLDYKSNSLGREDADYTPAALQGAMAEHRYDVQAALYLLALHRLLQARLGAAYDPAQHLGGAVYFFLRGIHGPTQGCYHVAPPLALLAALDALLQGQTALAA